jgi:hypothetical protein
VLEQPSFESLNAVMKIDDIEGPAFSVKSGPFSGFSGSIDRDRSIPFPNLYCAGDIAIYYNNQCLYEEPGRVRSVRQETEAVCYHLDDHTRSRWYPLFEMNATMDQKMFNHKGREA